MTEHTSDDHGIETLLDEVMNGTAERDRFNQINLLLRRDKSLCFDVVNYAELNAELQKSAHHRDPLSFFLNERQVEKKAGRRMATVLGAVASLALVAVVGFMIAIYSPAPPAAGKLVGLSADAIWSGEGYRPGDLILERMTVTIKKGIASFKLNNGVVISIEGPTTIQATNSEETRLLKGLLYAAVPEKAIGYTVRTEDAEIIDLGTVFVVERNEQSGTRVVVNKGVVEARAINNTGQSNVHELTAGLAMQFQGGVGVSSDPASWLQITDLSQRMERIGNGIEKMDGDIRISSSYPTNLREDIVPTNGHLLVLHEEMRTEIQQELQLSGRFGEHQLEPGDVINSYLIHYNPLPSYGKGAKGSITFSRPIYAILDQTAELTKTDSLFSDGNMQYSNDEFRGMEVDDTISLSEDRRTLYLHPGVHQDNYLDQLRILFLNARQ
ncbi:FecR family protein [Calycomorphotria hydatis]|uniref:FecR protein n=1 Tax=Calycomorphotria hydatis TaxID=2528027 RepID=A0A517TE75_9PLAN|nr:FecR family protein [Calycomorphotria hydatis]QDT66681.1 FecR protein [Calycomorphotria hydatis]